TVELFNFEMILFFCICFLDLLTRFVAGIVDALQFASFQSGELRGGKSNVQLGTHFLEGVVLVYGEEEEARAGFLVGVTGGILGLWM
ncbi:hypothetical protein BKA70DRAFT_1296587, partial [Coprinopsis sp. MPI-PUGE-AT-0042]